jgi:glycosyltransferase involved in cell wall biosynthesis
VAYRTARLARIACNEAFAATAMSQPPVFSICVPTYNRGRYLASLLESLVVQMAAFPYPYEIVISDNASSDDTPAVVARFAGQLPIRSIRHAETLGCYPNVVFAMTQARGRYMMYLADDDCVLGDALAEVVATMEADPAVVITYAPWMLYDLVAQQPQGQFYEVPRDLRVEQGQYAELLGHILRHHVFPEIYVARTEVMKRLMPRVNDIAFYAFSQAADYLNQGAVLIRKQPFYVAITRYFADDVRSQVGNGEVEVAWDRYRGGLEYMMARAGNAIGAEERAGLHLRIQHLIAVRMSVAIRLRHNQNKDPLDVHTLAMRLKGMGYEHLLPVPMKILASKATLHFLLEDTALNRGMERLVCVGPFDADAKDYLKQHAARPVDFLGQAPKAHVKDALLFVSDRIEGFDPPVEEQQARNLHIVRERDLCDRFGLVPG